MVEGVPTPARVVAPAVVTAPGPPYMPAFAFGDYTHHPLGRTAAGTRVGLWTLPATADAALAVTTDLASVFDWLEVTYGSYLFGDEVASVIVDRQGSTGGMEHHPFWHVAASSAGDAVMHAHEAAHGWFGNGVRIACWEDFALSEGLAAYLAARALEAVRGDAAGDDVWRRYRLALQQAVRRGDTVARPRAAAGSSSWSIPCGRPSPTTRAPSSFSPTSRRWAARPWTSPWRPSSPPTPAGRLESPTC